MARTPLLLSLKSLFADYRAAHAARLPLDASREVRAAARARAGGVTRRSFIAGAGAGAVALALPRRARAARSPEIAIVGGGIAGLTCALELADRNIDSTVYEASGRAGGRMFSNPGYFADGQVSEWCGELIDTGHQTVRHLAQRFDLPLDDLLAAQTPGSEDTYRFDGAYYPKAQADADFAAVYQAVSDDLDDAGYPTLYNAFTAAGQALDGMSVHDWIESRVPGGHASPMGQLLDVAYVIEFGADTHDQSALNLVYLLGFQQSQHPSFSVFGQSDERFHIRGGNQRLPRAIADSLGSAVKLGYSLLRVARTPAGRYSLTFQRGSGTVNVTADYVVMAIPFAVLRDLDYADAGFDALKDEAIQDLGRGHNSKTQPQFNQRVWNQTGPWPGVSNGATFTDAGYQASWEASRGQPGGAGLLVFYGGGSVTDAMHTSSPFATIADSGVRADTHATLQRAELVLPGLTARWNGLSTQSIPHKSDFFRLAYSYWRVGQYTAFSGYERERQGGVLFCGEHTSTDFQGFMEGGASEGKRAAKDLAQLMHGNDATALVAL
jgi:monoamine oxidase